MRRTGRVALVTCAFFVVSLSPGVTLEAVGRKKKAETAPATTPSAGLLRISCPVDGASFEIDEGSSTAIKGVTPVSDPVPLSPGVHTIRVYKEGYLPYSDVFDVLAGRTTELDVDMALYSGRLRVEASPGPIEVHVDGKPWGPAPVTVDLSIGEHVVRLTREGYVEEVRKAHIRTGQTTELSVTMTPVEVAQQAAGTGSVWKQWWFWTLIGVVAAGVAIPTAVVLTRQEDEPARFDGEPIRLP